MAQWTLDTPVVDLNKGSLTHVKVSEIRDDATNKRYRICYAEGVIENSIFVAKTNREYLVFNQMATVAPLSGIETPGTTTYDDWMTTVGGSPAEADDYTRLNDDGVIGDGTLG